MRSLLSRVFLVVGFSSITLNMSLFFYRYRQKKGHCFLACRVSAEKSAGNYMDFPFILFIVFPSFLSIISLFLNFCQFDYSVSHQVPPWFDPVWDSLCFWDLCDFFLSHVRELFSYYICKYFLRPFLSLSPIWELYTVNVVAFLPCLNGPLIYPLFFFLYSIPWKWFIPLCLPAHLSVFLPLILLFIPSSIFFISVIFFFNCVWLFFIFSSCVKKLLVTSSSVHPFFPQTHGWSLWSLLYTLSQVDGLFPCHLVFLWIFYLVPSLKHIPLPYHCLYIPVCIFTYFEG